jgi:hypothetical protein
MTAALRPQVWPLLPRVPVPASGHSSLYANPELPLPTVTNRFRKPFGQMWSRVRRRERVAICAGLDRPEESASRRCACASTTSRITWRRSTIRCDAHKPRAPQPAWVPSLSIKNWKSEGGNSWRKFGS